MQAIVHVGAVQRVALDATLVVLPHAVPHAVLNADFTTKLFYNIYLMERYINNIWIFWVLVQVLLGDEVHFFGSLSLF